MFMKVYSTDEITALILPILNKYQVEGAILFGSYARGDATLASDIDLLVIGSDKFDPTDIFCIADELYEKSGKNVDVYELREVKEQSGLYNAIMQEGIRLA